MIEMQLRKTPESADRRIAFGSSVDHKTVAAVRSHLESTWEIPKLE
jgi:hypothetical protein